MPDLGSIRHVVTCPAKTLFGVENPASREAVTRPIRGSKTGRVPGRSWTIASSARTRPSTTLRGAPERLRQVGVFWGCFLACARDSGARPQNPLSVLSWSGKVSTRSRHRRRDTGEPPKPTKAPRMPQNRPESADPDTSTKQGHERPQGAILSHFALSGGNGTELENHCTDTRVPHGRSTGPGDTRCFQRGSAVLFPDKGFHSRFVAACRWREKPTNEFSLARRPFCGY
jgi:hypothetical protein